MPHSEDQPQDWLTFARDDLDIARAEHVARIRCFDAQQAAEKAIKVVLMAHDIDLPWTHSLSVFIKLLCDQDEPFTPEHALGLTDYAVEIRFPRPDRSISEHDVTETVALAQAVLA